MATIGTAALLMAGASVVGAGVSIYGSQMSADAQRNAASMNHMLTDKQADATLAVAQYQANLNYNTAMAQSAVFTQNAKVQHQVARTEELLGFQQANSQYQQDMVANSSARAKYGASGVESDSGSPVVVAAYNAGQQQLQRMNTAYDANIKAMTSDWAGALSTYQAKLTQETAAQYKYAGEMAAWTNQAVKAGAVVTQYQADNAATATQIAGISSAISQIGQAAGSYGNLSYMSAKVPTSAIPIATQ